MAALAACATGQYRPPGSTPPPPNERAYAAPFDDTWAALVEHVSSTFFAISGFEKSSGLMTLTFGSDQPERFVDCGHMNASVAGRSVDMPYTQYLVEYQRAALQGRMNLLARSDGDGRTTVRVSSRYILTAPASQYAPPVTFSFDSDTRHTVNVPQVMQGTIPTRTCAATGEAERQVLDGIERALATRRR